MWNFIGSYIVIQLIGDFCGMAKKIKEEDTDHEIPRVLGQCLLIIAAGALVITLITLI